MNKLTKLGFAFAGVQAVGALVVGARYAKLKRAVSNTELESWIKEVVGDIPFGFEESSIAPAHIQPDKSYITFRMSDDDLRQLATVLNVSVKTAVQTIAVHEYGHVLDPKLQERWDMEQAELRKGNIDKYASLVMERETVAWALGKAHAPNLKYYDAYNKHNLVLYKESLQALKDEHVSNRLNQTLRKLRA